MDEFYDGDNAHLMHKKPQNTRLPSPSSGHSGSRSCICVLDHHERVAGRQDNGRLGGGGDDFAQLRQRGQGGGSRGGGGSGGGCDG